MHKSKGSILPLILIVVVIAFVVAFILIFQNKTKNNQPETTETSTQSGYLKEEYQNPFKEKSQYQNPFSEDSYENPFDKLK